MVKRDRNHASVVIWSYCNEGACSAGSGGGFRAITEAFDGTRPTLGNHHGNPRMDANTDVEGFSHKGGSSFDSFHAQNTTKPLFASECCSCIPNVRCENFQADCIAGSTNQSNGRPFVSGIMVWTLFDYYGDSHGCPHVSSQYGSFDLAGFEKGGAWWYRSWWLDNTPPSSDDRPAGYAGQTHVCRIWHDRWDGADAKVHVVTAAPFVELFLNGASLGTQGVAQLKYGSWGPSFAPKSNLTAQCRAADNKTVLASHTIVAPGAAAALRLSLDAPSQGKGTGSALLLDGQDVAMLRAEVLDAQGGLVTSGSANVTFEVTAGPGRVIASHNAPRTLARVLPRAGPRLRAGHYGRREPRGAPPAPP